MKKILIADDDPAIRELLLYHFQAADFEVDLAVDGQEALDLARTGHYDLLLLDVMMPVYSGIDLVKKLRTEGNFSPILILTARDDDELKLQGLGLGADDYLDKTTPMEEILVRVQGLIRRAQVYTKQELATGDLQINFQKKAVRLNDAPIELTKREFDILEFLVKRKGEIVSRDELLIAFWGLTQDDVETRTIDVLVGRLRKKLANRYIRSKRGFGYYFDENFEV